MMRKITLGLLLVILISCTNEKTDKPVTHSVQNDFYQPEDEPESNSVYTYWYVQYDSKVIRGFDVIKIKSNYVNINLMLTEIKRENGIKDDEYTQICYMRKVTIETYNSLH